MADGAALIATLARHMVAVVSCLFGWSRFVGLTLSPSIEIGVQQPALLLVLQWGPRARPNWQQRFSAHFIQRWLEPASDLPPPFAPPLHFGPLFTNKSVAIPWRRAAPPPLLQIKREKEIILEVPSSVFRPPTELGANSALDVAKKWSSNNSVKLNKFTKVFQPCETYNWLLKWKIMTKALVISKKKTSKRRKRWRLVRLFSIRRGRLRRLELQEAQASQQKKQRRRIAAVLIPQPGPGGRLWSARNSTWHQLKDYRSAALLKGLSANSCMKSDVGSSLMSLFSFEEERKGLKAQK